MLLFFRFLIKLCFPKGIFIASVLMNLPVYIFHTMWGKKITDDYLTDSCITSDSCNHQLLSV